MQRPIWFLTLALLAAIASAATARWDSLRQDELHDPRNPAIDVLQEPGEALSVLAPDPAGNKVDWVASLQQGLIQPRTSLDGMRTNRVRETSILMRNTLPMRYVRFPHRPHTEWMACESCHDRLFVAEAGANDINMGRILEGKDCGVCHGAVSFPLTECDRCHNTDSSTVTSPANVFGPDQQVPP